MDKMFKITTFGCKVNQYETQLIREGLVFAGCREAESSQNAQLCIVNTCTVTGKADKDSREAIRRHIRENPDAEIVAAGCYAEAEEDTIKAIDERIRILNNTNKLQIEELLGRFDGFAAKRPTKHSISFLKGYTKAFVKIHDGCNNFCSYCKVPYVRGRSRSRSPSDILEEAGGLINNGYKELVLIGICLGDFGKELRDDTSLPWLIRNIGNIAGDFRIRISSIELPDVSDELIREMAYSRRLCHHLHIPLQSGNDEILKRMNRRYTSSEFIERVGYIRSQMPDAAITTDIIVGFPNETDPNFKNTLEAIKRIKPSRTHIFTYSPRKGTKAFDMKDDIHPDVKKIRFRRLKELTDRFAEEFRLRSCQKRQRVLIEDMRDRNTGLLTGYTDTYIKVLLDGPDELMGRLILN